MSDAASALDTLHVCALQFSADLRLVSFTEPSVRLLKLSNVDIGLPADDLGPRIGYPSIGRDLRFAREEGSAARTISLGTSHVRADVQVALGTAPPTFVVTLTYSEALEQWRRALGETADGREPTGTQPHGARRFGRALLLAEHRERLRIAQVLHDDLQQMLHAARIRLDVALDEGGSFAVLGPPARQLLRDATALTRTLTGRLTSHEEGASVRDALAELADDVHDRFGLDVEVSETGGVRALSEGVTRILADAVRELLFNVVKHAGADAAAVRVVYAPESVEVTVEDDGRGFGADVRPAAPSPDGFGLTQIRSRLRAMSGGLEVESDSGQGTRVTLHLPTPAER